MFLKIIFVPTLSEGDLIDRNAQFLLALLSSKRPPRIEPWWPSFCGLKSLLNTAINKRPVFFLEVVTYKTFFS